MLHKPLYGALASPCTGLAARIKPRKQKWKPSHFPIFTPARLHPTPSTTSFCTYLGQSRAAVTEKETLYISGLITLSHQSQVVSIQCQCLIRTNLQDAEHLVQHPMGIPLSTSCSSIRPNT